MYSLAQIEEQEVNQDGQLSTGFLFASIKNTGNTIAQVNGVNLEVGEAKAYPFVGKGYEAISYVTNGTTLQIMQVL